MFNGLRLGGGDLPEAFDDKISFGRKRLASTMTTTTTRPRDPVCPHTTTAV
jgi:hypothetical protein